MIYNISRIFSNFTSWFFPHFVKRAYFTAFHPKLFCYLNIATEIHNVMCIANVLQQYTSWCSSLFVENLWDTVSAEVLRALALLLILSRSPQQPQIGLLSRSPSEAFFDYYGCHRGCSSGLSSATTEKCTRTD